MNNCNNISMEKGKGQCILDSGHPGDHQDSKGQTWKQGTGVFLVTDLSEMEMMEDS